MMNVLPQVVLLPPSRLGTCSGSSFSLEVPIAGAVKMDEFKGPGSTCLYDPLSEEVTKRLEWVETGVSGLMYAGAGENGRGGGVDSGVYRSFSDI